MTRSRFCPAEEAEYKKYPPVPMDRAPHRCREQNSRSHRAKPREAGEPDLMRREPVQKKFKSRASGQDPDYGAGHHQPSSGQIAHQQRPDEIELLLYRETP